MGTVFSMTASRTTNSSPDRKNMAAISSRHHSKTAPEVTMQQIPLFTVCRRWRQGRTSYRPAGEVINPHHYFAEPIEERVAKQFIETHHYSRSYPAARFRVGYFA
jgi:hypothetical protein